MKMEASEVSEVLVIGGGVAGMQASLDLADNGYTVHLVERTPSIGGRMSQLDKTFPTGDCALCILAPKMVEVARHPNIKLHAYSEVSEVSGAAGNFTVTVRKKPRYIDESKCTGCVQCIAVCRLKDRIPSEFEVGIGKRGAVYIPFLQAVPQVATIDENKCLYLKIGQCGKKGETPPCQEACTQGAIDFEQKEKILDLNVGAIIVATGLDVYDPSDMTEYGYGTYPNVVTSLEYERIMCASGPTHGHILRPSDQKPPKKIAWIQCVGSRDVRRKEYCSAVCCMYATKQAIITKEHEPDMEEHICYIDLRAHGKGFNEYTMRARDEYGVTYNRGRVCNIKEDLDTHELTLYLYNFNKDAVEELKVDMAVLCPALIPSAGTQELAKILGIETDKNGFIKEKSADAINETSVPGIFSAGLAQGPKDIPDTVAQASGAAAKVGKILGRIERGVLEEKDRIAPVREIKPDEEPRIGIMVCHCGINIGGVVDVPEVVEYAKSLPNVEVAVENRYACSSEAQNVLKDMIKERDLNRLIVASCTPRTHEALFMKTCEEAGLNPFLFELVNIRDQCSWVHMKQPTEATQKAKDLVRMYTSKARRFEPIEVRYIDVKQEALVIGGGVSGMAAALDIASRGFQTYLVERENELGGLLKDLYKIAPKDELAEDIIQKKVKAVKEQPNIKTFLNSEIKSIEGYVGNFNVEILENKSDTKEITVGVIVVATGGQVFEPEGMFAFGKSGNIITQLELENRLKNEEIDDLENIVTIQCVGAREKEGRTYCSRICCTAALKNAMLLRERLPNANIYICNRDIVTPAKNLEEYYRKARGQNITFLRYTEDKPPSVNVMDDKVNVEVFDTVSNTKLCLDSDLIVLSTPLIAQEDAKELSKQLKVPLVSEEEGGFFLEAHVKLRPVDFATDGIFLCGVAHGPKSVGEAIAQASGAASRAGILLSRGTLETIGTTAVIDEDRCIGCGTCISICPYNAIEPVEIVREFEDIKLIERKSRVNQATCKGCGTCVAACPVNAISHRHFTTEQIVDMVRACLSEEA